MFIFKYNNIQKLVIKKLLTTLFLSSFFLFSCEKPNFNWHTQINIVLINQYNDSLFTLAEDELDFSAIAPGDTEVISFTLPFESKNEIDRPQFSDYENLGRNFTILYHKTDTCETSFDSPSKYDKVMKSDVFTLNYIYEFTEEKKAQAILCD